MYIYLFHFEVRVASGDCRILIFVRIRIDNLPFHLGYNGTGNGRDRSKIREGEGHGFSCKHKREGQTIRCMSLRGGHYFLCKDAGVKESIYNSSVVTVILP